MKEKSIIGRLVNCKLDRLKANTVVKDAAKNRVDNILHGHLIIVGEDWAERDFGPCDYSRYEDNKVFGYWKKDCPEYIGRGHMFLRGVKVMSNCRPMPICVIKGDILRAVISVELELT